MERRSGRKDTFVLKRPKSGSKQIRLGMEGRPIEYLTIGLAPSLPKFNSARSPDVSESRSTIRHEEFTGDPCALVQRGSIASSGWGSVFRW